MNFFEQLANRSRAIDSLLCIGLDPDFSRHRVEEVAPYLIDIIAATQEFAACYKPNLAFYEQWGIPGLRALERVLEAIPPGVPTIGDAKRGDIGTTAAAYARALFEAWGFGAVTLSPYLGRDAIDPFLAYRERGVYVLSRNSNPSAREFQERPMADGRPLYEHVAMTASGWSPSVGLVVGATAPAELRRICELAPTAPLLVPGVGAQGGSAAEVVQVAGYRPGLVVVSVSRGVLYAGEGPAAPSAAAVAARSFRDEMRRARDAVGAP